MSDKEDDLYGKLDAYIRAVWLTRFYPELLPRWMLKQYLQRIDYFTKRWPKEAAEISNEIGWPDEIPSVDSSRSSRSVDVESLQTPAS